MIDNHLGPEIGSNIYDTVKRPFKCIFKYMHA